MGEKRAACLVTLLVQTRSLTSVDLPYPSLAFGQRRHPGWQVSRARARRICRLYEAAPFRFLPEPGSAGPSPPSQNQDGRKLPGARRLCRLYEAGVGRLRYPPVRRRWFEGAAFEHPHLQWARAAHAHLRRPEMRLHAGLAGFPRTWLRTHVGRADEIPASGVLARSAGADRVVRWLERERVQHPLLARWPGALRASTPALPAFQRTSVTFPAGRHPVGCRTSARPGKITSKERTRNGSPGAILTSEPARRQSRLPNMLKVVASPLSASVADYCSHSGEQ